jgi:hypothetical protein
MASAALAVPRAATATAAAVATAPRAGTIAWPLPRLAPRQRPAKPAKNPVRRVGAFVVSLPDHSLLDRLVRGRAWIPLLGVLLAGVVATQVEILKLGASMGRAIEQTTTLTSENEQLRGNVAMLSDDQRIERLASAMGMVLPPPGAVGYLSAGSNPNVGRALANLHSPDPSSFVDLTPQAGDGALVTGQGTSTLPPPAGAPTPTIDTPSATSDSTASSAITTSSDALSPTTTDSVQGTATTPSAPASTPQPPAATTDGQTTGSPTPTDTGQTDSSAPTDQGTPADQATQTDQGTQDQTTSGAAAIQPADSNQQSGGG